MIPNKDPGEEDSRNVPFIDEVMTYVRTYFWSIDMTAMSYIRLLVVPSLIIAMVISIVAFNVDLPGHGAINILIAVFGWFVHFITLAYPYMQRDSEAKEVRENFHLFITHFATLALSNVDRIEVFRELAKDKEQHGAIAGEMNRIIVLVDTWNLSLDEACLILSKHTPSDLMSSFLERLAHNVNAGQSLDEFLADEQDTILQRYSAQYKADLERIKVFAEAYLSLMLSLSFAVIFGVIAPILAPVPPIPFISAVFGGFIVAQFAFAVVIHTVSPEDFLWYEPDELTAELQLQRKVATAFGVVGTILIGSIFAILELSIGSELTSAAFTIPVEIPFSLPDILPYYIYIAMASLPALATGLYIMYLERMIMKRDDQFPGFIRGLGATESIRDSSTGSVLRDLRTKDFGHLTPQIMNLYRRMRSRTGREKAWKMFSSESGSYLIKHFVEMYRLGRSFGGDTKKLSLILSQNFTAVLRLREHRSQATNTLIGLIYGLLTVSSFAFFVALEVIGNLLTFREDIEMDEIDIVSFEGYDLFVIEALILLVIIATAIASSIIIRLAQRKSLAGGLTHFSLILWLAMISATFVSWAAGEFAIM